MSEGVRLTLYGAGIALAMMTIPMTEAHAVKSRGAAYREYQRTTSPFIPWKRNAFTFRA